MEALILIGLQASGKSSFAKALLSDTHIRLNLDMLRTRRRESVLIRACLEAKQRFVWDGTNATKRERAGVVAAAKTARFRVHAFWFEPDLAASIERNTRRPSATRVPVGGLHATRARLEPPRFEEGFDAIFSVRIAPRGRFTIEEHRRDF